MATKPYTLRNVLTPTDVQHLDKMLDELYVKVRLLEAAQAKTTSQRLTRTLVGS